MAGHKPKRGALGKKRRAPEAVSSLSAALPAPPLLGIDPEALYTTAQIRRLIGNKSAVTMWRWGRAGMLGPIVRLKDRKHFYGRYIISLVEGGLAKAA
jgi:hypothetical protein